MRRAWLLLLAPAAYAHVVSMSAGDLAIDGTHGQFELRMPLYEISHVQAPERTLLEHIRFAGARMVSSACRPEPARDLYVCEAAYEFRAPPVDNWRSSARCPPSPCPTMSICCVSRWARSAIRAIFDISFPRSTLRFRPPTPLK